MIVNKTVKLIFVLALVALFGLLGCSNVENDQFSGMVVVEQLDTRQVDIGTKLRLSEMKFTVEGIENGTLHFATEEGVEVPKEVEFVDGEAKVERFFTLANSSNLIVTIKDETGRTVKQSTFDLQEVEEKVSLLENNARTITIQPGLLVMDTKWSQYEELNHWIYFTNYELGKMASFQIQPLVEFLEDNRFNSFFVVMESVGPDNPYAGKYANWDHFSVEGWRHLDRDYEQLHEELKQCYELKNPLKEENAYVYRVVDRRIKPGEADFISFYYSLYKWGIKSMEVDEYGEEWEITNYPTSKTIEHSVNYDKDIEDILFKTVEVTFNVDGSPKANFYIEWDENDKEAYDNETPGTYKINGTVDIPVSITSPTSYNISIEVTVKAGQADFATVEPSQDMDVEAGIIQKFEYEFKDEKGYFVDSNLDVSVSILDGLQGEFSLNDDMSNSVDQDNILNLNAKTDENGVLSIYFRSFDADNNSGRISVALDNVISTTGTLTLIPGSIDSKESFVLNPGEQIAGQSFNLDITLKDEFENNLLDGDYNVLVESEDKDGTVLEQVIAFTNGDGTGKVSLTLNKTGLHTLVVTVDDVEIDQIVLEATGIDDEKSEVSVISPQIAGEEFELTVTLKDADANVVEDGNYQVTVISDKENININNLEMLFTGGTANVPVTLTKGERTIHTLTVIVDNVELFVKPEVEVISAKIDEAESTATASSPQTAGLAFDLDIILKDEFKNNVEDGNYKVTVESDQNENIVLDDEVVNITDGTGTVQITLSEATSHTLTVIVDDYTESFVIVDDLNIVVNPGSIVQIHVSGEETIYLPGKYDDPVIERFSATAFDNEGNLVVNANLKWELVILDNQISEADVYVNENTGEVTIKNTLLDPDGGNEDILNAFYVDAKTIDGSVKSSNNGNQQYVDLLLAESIYTFDFMLSQEGSKRVNQLFFITYELDLVDQYYNERHEATIFDINIVSDLEGTVFDEEKMFASTLDYLEQIKLSEIGKHNLTATLSFGSEAVTIEVIVRPLRPSLELTEPGKIKVTEVEKGATLQLYDTNKDKIGNEVILDENVNEYIYEGLIAGQYTVTQAVEVAGEWFVSNHSDVLIVE